MTIKIFRACKERMHSRESKFPGGFIEMNSGFVYKHVQWIEFIDDDKVDILYLDLSNRKYIQNALKSWINSGNVIKDFQFPVRFASISRSFIKTIKYFPK